MKRNETKQGRGFFWHKDDQGRRHLCIRPWRWLVALSLALAFIFSFFLDVQVLEGSIIASRLVGFHMVDLFGGLEVIAAHGEIAINLMMGMIFVGVVYWIFGGRSFCSWVCPYGLLSEWSEVIHLQLVRRGIIYHRKNFSTRYKYVFVVAFLLASYVSGYLVFETINPIGIVSRALIYGLLESTVIVVLFLLVEVFFYRRFWCRSLCPSGAVYGLMNRVSVIRLEADASQCDHCGLCTPQCHVPEALAPIFTNKSGKVFLCSTDCTFCCRCIDVCPRNVIHISHRLKALL